MAVASFSLRGWAVPYPVEMSPNWCSVEYMYHEAAQLMVRDCVNKHTDMLLGKYPQDSDELAST